MAKLYFESENDVIKLNLAEENNHTLPGSKHYVVSTSYLGNKMVNGATPPNSWHYSKYSEYIVLP